MNVNKWEWMDFYYVAIGRMDSRRAAFMLFDFVNMFDVDDFKVIQTEGSSQNTSLQVLYKLPKNKTSQQIEDEWYEYVESVKAGKS